MLGARARISWARDVDRLTSVQLHAPDSTRASVSSCRMPVEMRSVLRPVLPGVHVHGLPRRAALLPSLPLPLPFPLTRFRPRPASFPPSSPSVRMLTMTSTADTAAAALTALTALTATTASTAASGSRTGSVHTSISSTPIHEMPMSAMLRPLASTLDTAKVERLKVALTEDPHRDDIDPVDVLHVRGTEGGHYYYAFGGCHRYAAHKQLGLDTIRVRLVPATVDTLRVYLGGSTPNLK